MSRKTVFTIILSLLVISAFTSAFKIQSVKASITIVVPDDYPTIQAALDAANPGDIVFVRAGTYNESVLITKTLSLVGESSTNTIIDSGGSQNYVVTIESCTDVNISGFTIRNGYYGIGAWSSWPGILVSNVNIIGNIITGNQFFGINVPGFYGYSANFNITGNNITNNGNAGVYIVDSTNNRVEENNITGNNAGGIVICYLGTNAVVRNDVENNIGYGIYSWRAHSLISQNKVANNTSEGMFLGASYNTVTENTVINNPVGIYVNYPETGNTLYHNDFVNNTQQALSDGNSNTWDNGYPSGGNYWSDYNGTDSKSGSYQDQLGSDGIGDTPYIIDVNNIDNYPLMQFWSPIYNVTFNESGLPPGDTWNVTLNGVPQSTSNSQINFTEPIGQYPFSITSTSDLVPSPITQGTLDVEGDTIIAITWGSASVQKTAIREVGLPPNTPWSVAYQQITNTSTTDTIDFNFFQGTPTFSIYCADFSANPPLVYFPAGSTTSVIFVPNSNSQQFTSWNPAVDSYSTPNPETTWSASGNCYGLSSTALLYFMHYSMGDDTSPFFPMQPPSASSTSNLDLGSSSSLNNASLATMIHQKYDPQNDYIRTAYQFYQFEALDSSLRNGLPVVLVLWNSTPNVGHAVVAWGDGLLWNGSYAIVLYDPNYPEVTQIAIYDTNTESFSYGGGTPFEGNGPFDHFIVRNPTVISMSWFNEWTPAKWFEKVDESSVVNYTLLVAEKSADEFTVTSNGMMDYFTTSGDSQSFVGGIPDSSGIEEGDVQVYAIPSTRNVQYVDPGSNESLVFVSRVKIESGRLVEYGYLANTTTTSGSLNFTVTPTDSGLLIDAGDNGLNATVTYFSATQQGYSVSDVMTAQIDAGQSVNLTAPCVASFTASKNVVGKGYLIPVKVTVTNVGDNPENVTLTLYVNSTTLDTETVFNLLNGTSTTLAFVGNTSSCAYGNYTLSIYSEPSGVNEAATNFTYTGIVQVTIPGDITGLNGSSDWKVDMRDIGYVARRFMCNPGDLFWDPNADINSDGTINMKDIGIAARHFLEQYP